MTCSKLYLSLDESQAEGFYTLVRTRRSGYPSSEQQEAAAGADATIGRMSLALFPMSSICTLTAASAWPAVGILPPIILSVFCIIYACLRTRLNDLVLIQGIVMVLYSLTPHLAKGGADPISAAFGIEDANYLHNIAISCYFLAVWVVLFFYPVRESDSTAIVPSKVSASKTAPIIGAVLSILLALIYLSRFGFVVGGSLDYGESFERQQTSHEGSGLLLLSIPLAISSLALALSHHHSLLSKFVLTPLFSFFLLFIVHGQRKYVLIPLIFIGVSRLRVRRISAVVLALIGISIGWYAFCYLGFLRVQGYSITRAFDPPVVNEFIDQSGDYLGGETVALAGTGSAAVQGIVKPLPHFGDYTDMWQVLVPQFLIRSDFEPINVRFAYAWNPLAAEKGGGWGFDFWGEAYVIDGPLMILFAALLIAGLFRFIYIRATYASSSSFWSAFAIIGSYYALWFQRNGAAYLFREYFVFSAGVLLLLILVAWVIDTFIVSSSSRS